MDKFTRRDWIPFTLTRAKFLCLAVLAGWLLTAHGGPASAEAFTTGDRVVALVAPTLQRYLTGDLE